MVPGENVIATEFHYMPDNANDTIAQSFLTQFIQSADALDLTIQGDTQSTPFASLQAALAGVQLSTNIPGLNHPQIITHTHVVITLDSLTTNLVTVDFDVQNPLETDMVIEFTQAEAKVDGTTYAFIIHAFDNFVIPPGQTVNSGPIENVPLTQGALASLDIIPLGMLDISAANTIRIGGPNGYQIPWLQLNQPGVPTSYDLSLSLDGVVNTVGGLLGAAKSILTGNEQTSLAASSETATATATVSGDGGKATETSGGGGVTESAAPPAETNGGGGGASDSAVPADGPAETSGGTSTNNPSPTSEPGSPDKSSDETSSISN